MSIGADGDTIGVIVADGHPLMVAGIEGRLSTEPDIEVLGTTTRADTLAEMVLRLSPSVVVVGFSVDALFDVVPVIRAIRIATHVLVLAASEHPHDVLRALEAGAAGYVSKEADGSLLASHIRAVAAGQTVLDRQAAAAIASDVRARRAPTVLSPREVEVLQRVSEGLSNRRIADALFVAPSTVKTHFDRIFVKLGVHSRSAALARAKEAGLLS